MGFLYHLLFSALGFGPNSKTTLEIPLIFYFILCNYLFISGAFSRAGESAELPGIGAADESLKEPTRKLTGEPAMTA